MNCTKCGHEVVRRRDTAFEWLVLPDEATSRTVSKCPAGGLHEVDDEDEE